jgi:hypothetical protein
MDRRRRWNRQGSPAESTGSRRPAFATQQMHSARVSSNYLTPSRHPCEGRDPVTAPPPDCCETLNARAFVRLRRPSYLSLAWPRARPERARTAKPARRAESRMPGVKISNQQRRPPMLCACRASLPGKSVRRGRAFRQGILPWRKGVDIPVDSPAGLSSPPHRRTGGRVEQRAILARTRCATAARWRKP